MFDPKRALAFLRKFLAIYLTVLLAPFVLSVLAVYGAVQLGLRPWPSSLLDIGLPILMGMAPILAAVWAVWWTAGRFMRSLYGLAKDKDGRGYLNTILMGQFSGGPYLVVKEGRVATGSEAVRKIGGPGALVIYNDSAVVLERAGILTQVIRGTATPPFPLPPPKLKPFEKVWDVIDLRPQRWVFKVSAITQDGIPITYAADIGFQIGDTNDDVFTAATCKWVREAWRTEPDRLMTWTKRVIIGDTEGALRSILARYTLDDLLDADRRDEVRNELKRSLTASVPKLGAKILHVELGDIEVEDKVIQQWTAAWQAERRREVARTLAEGTAAGRRIREQTRIAVRTSMLADTAKMFAEIAARGQRVSRGFIILSFIDMVKRTASTRSFYLPDDIVKTLDMLEKRFGNPPT